MPLLFGVCGIERAAISNGLLLRGKEKPLDVHPLRRTMALKRWHGGARLGGAMQTF